jgi:3-hydroxyisobutyrate dehydrogenase-like beta-hydroxyacid dehydrogenase
MTTLTIAVLGLGEAGSLIAGDLVRAGAAVRGYDPRVPSIPDLVGTHDAATACRGADVVLSVNSAADALDALAQGLPGCTAATIWADLNTAAPSEKLAVQANAGERVRVVDVALMAPVPPHGLRTPMTASGPAAQAFAIAIEPFGATVTVIDGPIGTAATHKLLRSVFYKGMAAAVVEALAAARVAGLDDWLRGNIASALAEADASTVDRLVEGSQKHAVRREHEMRAAAQLLEDLGVPPRVSLASRDWLRDLAAHPHPPQSYEPPQSHEPPQS